MVYGERAQDRPEVFEGGALKWDGGVVLNRQHNRAAPIMRFEPRQDGDRVVIDAALPDTAAGRDAAREIRSGLFRGLSVEFKAVREQYRAGVRRIQAALLTGAALVDSPAYRTAVEVRGKRRRRYYA